jgi:hypothetical protein
MKICAKSIPDCTIKDLKLIISAGDFYYKLLAKAINENSYAFMKPEITRIENILKSGALEDTQFDQFTIRQNILSRLVAFIEAAGDVYVGHEEN